MGFQVGNTIWKGRHHTPETRLKMSLWQRGRKMSPEALENMRQASLLRFENKEDHPMFGRKHSAESKEKMSKARLGREPWNKGVKYSEETRRKISEERKSRYVDPTKHPRWKGGTKSKPDGRVLVHNPKHPNCDSQGYVRRSHLVMEKIIGRYLIKTEVIHHIDKDPTNDSPDNLQLFTNSNEHNRLHGKQDNNQLKRRK